MARAAPPSPCDATMSRKPTGSACWPAVIPSRCARFIVEAALGGRRSKIVGALSKVIVAGTKVSPSVLAHDAARTGVLSQQTDQDADPRRPSSLFEAAADADHGAPLAGSVHGRVAHSTLLPPKAAQHVHHGRRLAPGGGAREGASSHPRVTHRE